MTIEQAVTQICEAYGNAPHGGTPELFDILKDLVAVRQQIAKVPASVVAKDCKSWALRLISMSQRSDFPDDGEWGKWCRSVAGAGLAQDDNRLERLKQLNKV